MGPPAASATRRTPLAPPCRGAPAHAANRIAIDLMSAALADLQRFERLAEQAYSDMYDSRSPAGCYSDLKDCFALAIGAAERAGRADEAERLRRRLDHCIAVYRSQFSPF